MEDLADAELAKVQVRGEQRRVCTVGLLAVHGVVDERAVDEGCESLVGVLPPRRPRPCEQRVAPPLRLVFEDQVVR